MKTDIEDLTVSQKILIACHQLEERGLTPFAGEALVVEVWKLSPKTFGLKGFVNEYPDCNRVYACLMGERGLCKRGWMVKVGQKLYTLSRQGKEEARRILEADDSPLPKRRALAKIEVPKEMEHHLEQLFASVAYRRYKDKLTREITYKDACKFWGLAESFSGETIDQVLRRVPGTVEAIEQLLHGNEIEFRNGQTVSQKDLDTIVEVDQFLNKQFSRHLAQQRDRTRRF